MAEYKYQNVKIRIHDGIAWTSLNRPDKRNAMSPELHYDMDEALARLEVDDDVKVVVVTGEGGNFSAGQDLKKFFRELERNPAERKKAQAAANRWRWERLYGYDKPTIAMCTASASAAPSCSCWPATSQSPPRRRPSRSPR
jgi:trans-feruloyl-CoA hydratase/vanillin synthase